MKHKGRTLAFIGLLFLVLSSTTLLAQPGIEQMPIKPDFSTGELSTNVTDIEVKVEGGTVRIVREWVDGGWHWNRRWNPIELVGVTAPEPSTDESSLSVNLPYGIIRNGSAYIWDIIPTHSSHLAITDRHYIQDARRIDVNNEGESYTWHDRLGNTIHYEGPVIDADDSDDVYQPTMQMAWYSDKNDNKVTLHRNPQGDIDTISANGTTVLTYTYNAGNIQKITDYTGRSVEYYYTDGLLTSVRDVTGEVWSYGYDTQRVLNSYTTPESYTVTLVSDANGVLLSAIGADGIGTTYTSGYQSSTDNYTTREVDSTGKVSDHYYNALGHLVRVDINGERRYSVDTILSDNSTNVRKLVNNDLSKLGSNSVITSGSAINVDAVPSAQSQELTYIKTRIITDARGEKTRIDYDQWQNPIKITYPDGGVETRQYHANYSFPTKIIDESGTITEFSYDEAGNVTTLIEAKGLAEERKTIFTYDGAGHVTKITVAGDDNTAEAFQTFTYDGFGNLLTATTAEQALIQFNAYDALGNPHTVIDAREKTWSSNYDAAGNLLSENDPDNRLTTLSYDKTGRLIKLVASDNGETTFTYDGSLLTRIVDPLTEESLNNPESSPYENSLSYDKAGRITGITDATGRRYQTQYDSEGRIQSLIDGENNVTSYHYQDNQLSQVDFPTYSESYDYNSRDDIVATTIDANGQLRQYTRQYDRDQRNAIQTDTQTHTLQHDYDALGRLIRTTDTNGDVTLFAYDDRDNLIQVTDPEGRITRFTYDKANRLTREIKQNNSETTLYSYDASGNLTSIISAKNEKTILTYSDAGLLTQTEFYQQQADPTPEKTTTYAYNAAGLLETYADGTTSATYGYDKKQQLTTVTVNFGTFSKQFSYRYYANGLKKSYTSPEGQEYTYGYDGDGKLLTVSIPNAGQYSIAQYDWLAPSHISFPGGGSRTLTYDDTLRLTDRVYSDPANLPTYQSHYDYDSEDNIIGQTYREGEISYDYDNLYRLNKVTYTPDALSTSLREDEEYGYDKVGNRLATANSTQDWVYNDNNQLVETDTFSYDYDANGNQVLRTEQNTLKQTHYIYNSEQRLIRIEDNAQQIIAQYQYNPFGQRIAKTVAGNTTYFLYSQEGLVAEYDAAGQLLTEYHYEPDANWMTNPLFMRTGINNQVLYYHNDHIGAPQALYTKQGQAVWQAEYTAFGQAIVNNNTVTQNLRFPGQYYDEESDLHHNYLRDYDPTIGRYIQSDPIGLAGGINTYLYAAANPLMYVDPTGEFWWVGARLLYQGGRAVVANPWVRRTILAAIFVSNAQTIYDTGLILSNPCISTTEKVIAGGLLAAEFIPGERVAKAARNLFERFKAVRGVTNSVPNKFVKPGGGSDASDFITTHSQKHMFDASRTSTKKRSQFGQDINVKALVDDTMANPTSAYSDINSRITKYSKSYDFNISTPDTPTGEMRVFINNPKPDRSTQFPYVPRN